MQSYSADATILNAVGKPLPHMVALMARSKFCLIPPGDMLTRFALYQAILTACVPVVFRNDDAFWRQYAFASTVPYRELSLYIPEADVQGGSNWLHRLRETPMSEVHAKQALMRRWARVFAQETRAWPCFANATARDSTADTWICAGRTAAERQPPLRPPRV